MDQLRQRILDVAALIPAHKPVVYLDYPVHTNIGDLLIEKGAERFLSSLGYDVVERRSAYDFCQLSMKRVNHDMTIVLHGGGNFGDLYDAHQLFRERVIERFPDNRIVMLPQTLYFESEERLKACAALFSRHNNLHVCLRDEQSLATFQGYFSNPAYLLPDMAHFLWGDFPLPHTTVHDERTLFFARTDKEMSAFPDQGRGATDWSDLIRPQDEFLHRLLRKLHAKHHMIAGRWSLYPAWRMFLRDRLIDRAEQFIADYDAVVTNRLHMAIFCLLTGRKATMADNSYGKLSSYYSTWLKDMPNACFIAS